MLTLDSVASIQNLKYAWKKTDSYIRKNWFYDSLELDEFVFALSRNIRHLSDAILNQNYSPLPVKIIPVPKKTSNQDTIEQPHRPLGHVNIKDQVVWQAIVNVLADIFENDFSEQSYGYRLYRITKDNKQKFSIYSKEIYTKWLTDHKRFINDIISQITDGCWICEADIKGFYDYIERQILWDKIVSKLKEHGENDEGFLQFIKTMLGYTLEYTEGTQRNTTVGIPQGLATSGFLANIYLDELDHKMKANFPEIRYYRYVDDIRILCDTKELANSAKKYIADFLFPLNLELNPEKTKIVQITPKNKVRYINYTSRKMSKIASVQPELLNHKELAYYRESLMDILLTNFDELEIDIDKKEKFAAYRLSKLNYGEEFKDERQLILNHLIEILTEKRWQFQIISYLLAFPEYRKYIVTELMKVLKNETNAFVRAYFYISLAERYRISEDAIYFAIDKEELTKSIRSCDWYERYAAYYYLTLCDIEVAKTLNYPTPQIRELMTQTDSNVFRAMLHVYIRGDKGNAIEFLNVIKAMPNTYDEATLEDMLAFAVNKLSDYDKAQFLKAVSQFNFEGFEDHIFSLLPRQADLYTEELIQYMLSNSENYLELHCFNYLDDLILGRKIQLIQRFISIAENMGLCKSIQQRINAYLWLNFPDFRNLLELSDAELETLSPLDGFSSLEYFLQAGKELTEGKICQIIIKLCEWILNKYKESIWEAFGYGHLNPRNVYIQENEGEIKIAVKDLTKDPVFESPQQYTSLYLTDLTDCYSIGLLLMGLARGSFKFKNDYADEKKIMTFVNYDVLSQEECYCSSVFADIISRCITFNYNYPQKVTIKGIKNTLEKYLKELNNLAFDTAGKEIIPINLCPSLVREERSKKEVKDEITISICQIAHDVEKTICSKTGKFLESESQKIQSILDNMISQAIDDQSDIVIFPELTVPNSYLDKISIAARKKKIIFIGGYEYLNLGHGNKNRVIISIPENMKDKNKRYGPLLEYEQLKLFPAPIEHQFNVLKGRKLYLFKNTWVGDFAILNCYDFTNLECKPVLQGHVDYIIVTAYNKDLNTFDGDAETTARDFHCYVIICNTGRYGNSLVYAPYKEDYRRYLYKIIGNDLTSMQTVTLNIKDIRESQKSHKDLYKQHMAGFARKEFDLSYSELDDL